MPDLLQDIQEHNYCNAKDNAINLLCSRYEAVTFPGYVSTLVAPYQPKSAPVQRVFSLGCYVAAQTLRLEKPTNDAEISLSLNGRCDARRTTHDEIIVLSLLPFVKVTSY